MFNKVLQTDSTEFLKEKRIRANRPGEVWLEFLKQHVFIKPRKGCSWTLWLFLLPLALLVYTFIAMTSDSSYDTDYTGWFAGCAILFVVVLIIAGVASMSMGNNNLVNLNAVNELAKFIVKIKGDTYKNLIDISLDLSNIEDKKNLIALRELGLQETSQVKYAPYQLHRYQANVRLRDDSFCSVSLYQHSLEIATTKRRSSGKIKTKLKFKHKFYYILTLKLAAAKYEVAAFQQPNELYELSNRTKNGFHIVKIKCKEKLLALPIKITEKEQTKPSVFIEMMNYLFENKIITSTPDTLRTF